MIAAILFDLDGTLADTERVHWQSYRTVLLEYGIDIGLEEYPRHFIAADGGPEYACRTYGLPITADEVRARKGVLYRARIEPGVPPMPGPATRSSALAERPLAVVTIPCARMPPHTGSPGRRRAPAGGDRPRGLRPTQARARRLLAAVGEPRALPRRRASSSRTPRAGSAPASPPACASSPSRATSPSTTTSRAPPTASPTSTPSPTTCWPRSSSRPSEGASTASLRSSP